MVGNDSRTTAKMVGNIPPEQSAVVQLTDVPNVDTSGSVEEAFLFFRVVRVYSI